MGAASPVSVAVLKLGTGNVRSVTRALHAVGAAAEVTADPQRIADADGLVIPGQGSFDSVMRALRAIGAPRLIERRLAGGRAVLGICVGLQIMFASSEESPTGAANAEKGLDQWPGVVQKIPASILPHMGWTPVRAHPDSQLLEPGETSFYFAHSYGVLTDPSQVFADGPTIAPAVSFARHGQQFVAVVENGPLSAVQFHPEKSGEAGLRLLGRWISTLSTGRSH